jgi:nucleoside phosphorylase
VREHPGGIRYEASQVSIGIITALTIERLAVEQIMDDVVPVRFDGDHHPYRIGTVPSRDPLRPHVIALAQQTSDGTRDAAWLCGHMPHTFTGLRTIAMCGIAGGVPGKGVELGDIVVATEVVDYRHERLVDGKHTVRANLQQPGTVWVNADHEVEAYELKGVAPWMPLLDGANVLFRRPTAGRPRAHRKRVGSADLLVRDAVFRDGLASEYGIVAFEMEGAGIAIGTHLGDRPWFMVRGIADHGDNATKNDAWHPYASLTAAAYLRSVLAQCEPFLPGTQGSGTQRPAPHRPATQGPGGKRPAAHGPGTTHPGSGGLDPLDAMTKALVGLSVMQDDMQRRAVLNQLPARIRTQIPENAVGRLHIIGLVQACERFPDGLSELLSALGRTLDRESAEFVAVERVLRANWSGR